MSFLRDLALAHQHHEGYYPGSVSYRQNNPGNIRGPDGAFKTFPTYEAGLAALEGDLLAKIKGWAASVQRYMKGTGKAYNDLVFQDYVAIYAPSADHNDPIAYCDDLCKQLSKYNVQPSTPLLVLYQLVLGTISRVPDPPPPPLSLEQRLAMAQNALRWAKEPRIFILRRLIGRIQVRLTGGNSDILRALLTPIPYGRLPRWYA